jgi:hypothetical protein
MTQIARRDVLRAGAGGAAMLAVGLPQPPAGVRRRSDHGAGTVIEWNRTLLGILRTPGAHPATVHPTRSFAILHAAVHDAVTAATGKHRPYLFDVTSTRHASPVAAAAQAAHDTLVGLYPAEAGALDRQLAADLAAVPDRRARTDGVQVGALTAASVLANRADDRSAAMPPLLAPGTAPGEYRPTPPAFARAVFTHWPAVLPFVLDRADAFRPAAYPALDGDAYADAIKEVMSRGQDVSTSRIVDQTIQAQFWGAPIWNYWNEIAQSVVVAGSSNIAMAPHSTSPSPTRSSPSTTPSTTTACGDRSPPFGSRTATETGVQPPIPPGTRWLPHQLIPPTRAPTAPSARRGPPSWPASTDRHDSSRSPPRFCLE